MPYAPSSSDIICASMSTPALLAPKNGKEFANYVKPIPDSKYSTFIMNETHIQYGVIWSSGFVDDCDERWTIEPPTIEWAIISVATTCEMTATPRRFTANWLKRKMGKTIGERAPIKCVDGKVEKRFDNSSAGTIDEIIERLMRGELGAYLSRRRRHIAIHDGDVFWLNCHH